MRMVGKEDGWYCWEAVDARLPPALRLAAVGVGVEEAAVVGAASWVVVGLGWKAADTAAWSEMCGRRAGCVGSEEGRCLGSRAEGETQPGAT